MRGITTSFAPGGGTTTSDTYYNNSSIVLDEKADLLGKSEHGKALYYLLPVMNFDQGVRATRD